MTNNGKHDLQERMRMIKLRQQYDEKKHEFVKLRNEQVIELLIGIVEELVDEIKAEEIEC